MSYSTQIITRDQVNTQGHNITFRDHKIKFLVGEGTPPSPILITSVSDCRNCGAYAQWEVNPTLDTFSLTTACEYPEGIPPYTSILSVPSGALVISDSLFDIFSDPDVVVDYNSALGKTEYAKELEKEGLIYGAVLNTCPSVYRNTDTGELFVANLKVDLDTDVEELPENWELLANIATDLWAYSITDLSNYIAHGGTTKDHPTFVSVPSGQYHFTHYADQEDFNHHSSDLTIFARATFTPLN